MIVASDTKAKVLAPYAKMGITITKAPLAIEHPMK